MIFVIAMTSITNNLTPVQPGPCLLIDVLITALVGPAPLDLESTPGTTKGKDEFSKMVAIAKHTIKSRPHLFLP
jgi:hypothetical protein